MNKIFLHGGPGFDNYLEPFFKHESGSGNCYFYNQLKGPEVTMKDLIGQLDEIIDGLEGPVFLIGHSWGVALAIEYAFQFSEKLSGVVLMSSGISFNHWKTEFEQEKKNRGLTEAPAEEIFLSQSERSGWTDFLNNMWDTFSEETFDSLWKSFILDYDQEAKFKDLKLPMLNIFGSEDVRFPVRISRELRTINSRIETHEVQGAGHFPFLLDHHRKSVLDKIEKFICAVSAPTR